MRNLRPRLCMEWERLTPESPMGSLVVVVSFFRKPPVSLFPLGVAGCCPEPRPQPPPPQPVAVHPRGPRGGPHLRRPLRQGGGLPPEGEERLPPRRARAPGPPTSPSRGRCPGRGSRHDTMALLMVAYFLSAQKKYTKRSWKIFPPRKRVEFLASKIFRHCLCQSNRPLAIPGTRGRSSTCWARARTRPTVRGPLTGLRCRA